MVELRSIFAYINHIKINFSIDWFIYAATMSQSVILDNLIKFVN